MMKPKPLTENEVEGDCRENAIVGLDEVLSAVEGLKEELAIDDFHEDRFEKDVLEVIDKWFPVAKKSGCGD